MELDFWKFAFVFSALANLFLLALWWRTLRFADRMREQRDEAWTWHLASFVGVENSKAWRKLQHGEPLKNGSN